MIPFLRKFQNNMSRASERRNERLRRLRVKAKRRSFLEKLEDRHLMAALIVTNGNDSGDGSLRAMIEIANNNKQADTITFADGVTEVRLTSGQVTLKETGEGNKTAILGPVKISGSFGSVMHKVISDLPNVWTKLSGIEITGGTSGGVQAVGQMSLHDSTLHGNTGGPAILVIQGKTRVENSTISGNSHIATLGGGLAVLSGEATVVNSTVTNNVGGGAFANQEAKFSIHNSIIAGNRDFANIKPTDLLVSVTSDSSHNLVGDADSAGGLRNGENGNIVGVEGSGVRDISTVIDTFLAFNEGGTPNHALVANSPAIDAGNDSFVQQIGEKDQRGLPRLDGRHVDIGAVERVVNVIWVTNNQNTGGGSLRKAIEIANSNDVADTIKFVPDLVISVSGAQLRLTETGAGKKTTIKGPATIVLSDMSIDVPTRVFTEFSNLEITNATRGAITNSGNLVVQSSLLYANKNSNGGGAITGTAGLVTVINSTISGNEGISGAIRLDRGAKAVIVNSTLTDNRATSSGFGGGIDSIADDGPAVTIHNSIIAGNFNNNVPKNLDGKVTEDSSNNLVGEGDGGLKKENRNLVVSDLSSELSKVIGVLKGNGTHPLVVGGSTPNPAIDAGDFRFFPMVVTDQIGNPRIDGESIDIGAVEVQDDSTRNFLVFDRLMFVTTGTFKKSADGKVQTSNGVVEIGWNNDGTLNKFVPALRLRGGIEITTNNDGKSVFTTKGAIVAMSQGRLVDLMNGLVDEDPNQKIPIPLADLQNGYSIAEKAPKQAIESKISENSSFKASKLTILHDHLKLSGFLTFDVLQGAGIPVDNVQMSMTKSTAILTSQQFPLRTATNRLPSKQEPVVVTLGKTTYTFASPTLGYDRDRKEFKLEGRARVLFDTGSAEIEFFGTARSSILIRDGKFVFDRTTEANVLEFTIANVTYKPQSGNGSVELDFKKDLLSFEGRYVGSTASESSPSAANTTQNADEAKQLVDTRPKIELGLEGIMTWSLVARQVQPFEVRLAKFKIGTLLFEDTTEGKLRLAYDPTNYQYTILGKEQRLTQALEGDGNGNKITLNVGLNELSNDTDVTGTGIVITRGRVDAFKIPIRDLVSRDDGSVFRIEDKKDFAAHYNPLTRQLRIVGHAKLGPGNLGDRVAVDFGTLDTAKTVFNSDKATNRNVIYRFESFQDFDFKLDGKDLEATHDVIKGEAVYTGGGTWTGKGANATVTAIPSITAATNRGSVVIPRMRLDGTFIVNSELQLVLTGAVLQYMHNAGHWMLETKNAARIQIRIDGNYAPVQISEGALSDGALYANSGVAFFGCYPFIRQCNTGTSTKLIVSEGFTIAGVKIPSGEISLPEFDQSKSRVVSILKSKGPLDLKFGDTEVRAPVNLRLLLEKDGSLTLENDSKLVFVKRNSDEDYIANIGNVSFDRLSATYQESTKSFKLAGSGIYQKSDPPLPVSIGDPGSNGQISLSGGVSKITNFKTPKAVYNVAGIDFPVKGLRSTTDDVATIFKSEPGADPLNINVGGSRINLRLDELRVEFRGNVPTVTKIRGAIFGGFTVGGVAIDATGTLSYELDEKNTQTLRIGGTAAFKFQATQTIDINVSLAVEIRNGEITKLKAEFAQKTPITLLGMELTLKSGGFSYNRTRREFAAWGQVTLKTPDRFFKGIDLKFGAFREDTGDVTSPGLIIKEGKLESIDIGISTSFNLFGFTAEAEDLRLTYSRTNSVLSLTGGVGISFNFGVQQVTAEASFPGEGLQINTRTGEVSIHGIEFSVGGFKLGPVGLDEVRFKYLKQGGSTIISGSAKVTLPNSLTVAGGLELIDGKLNAIEINVQKTNPGIALGKTGIFLTSIKGSIKGISEPSNFSVKLEVTGSLGPTASVAGSSVNLLEISGMMEFTTTKATLSGTIKALGGYLHEGTGTVTVYYSGRVEVSVDIKMYGGILTGQVNLSIDRYLNLQAEVEVGLNIPNAVPLIGGKRLGTVRAKIDYRTSEVGIPDELSDEQVYRFLYGRRNARVHASIDVFVFKGQLDLLLSFTDWTLEGRARETGFVGKFAGAISSFFGGPNLADQSFKISLGRDLDLEIPVSVTEIESLDVPAPELTMGDVLLDPDGPGGIVTFTNKSHLPDTTTIDLYVDTDGDGYDGELFATRMAGADSQQTYTWLDLPNFTSVPYDPQQKLYVYGQINDGINFPVRSNYSAAITPPNFSPTISLPGEHSFGTNQPLVFSSSQQNAISFSDPLAEHDPDASLVVTLDVDHGNLTLDPQQATPWTNINNATDVDGSGGTQLSDALHLISMLNAPALQSAGGQLPSQRSTFAGTPMYDVNGDGRITTADAAALTDRLLNPATATTSNFVAPGVIIKGQGTGRLQLIGTAAAINRMLDGITYQSFENAFFDDRLEVTVNRFPEFSFNVHTDSIPLTARRLAVGSADGIDFLPVSYEQGSDTARLLGDFQIAGAMSGHIHSAMIAIEGYDAENDVLYLSRFDQLELGINASFDATTGKLHLTGSRLIQDYQRAIEKTTFSSHGNGNRVLRVQLGDGTSNVAESRVAVYIIAMNQAPVVTTGQGSTYVSGSSTAVSLLPSITVQDTDSATLRKAVITLDADSYRQGEDVLTYETAHNITGRFNALTGQLVLTGEAGQRAWSAALSSVKYRNSMATATPGVRQLNIVVDDGGAINSTGNAHQRLLVLAANTTLQSVVVGNLPSETATDVNDDDSITLAPGLTLTAGSSAIDSLVRVDVKITGNFIPGIDFLSVDGLLLGMEVNYDVMNGVLSITGNVPIEWYEYVLQHVNYSNRSLMHDGVARTFTFTVFDGFTESQSRSMTAQFEALPVVQAGMQVMVYETGKTTQPLDPNINVMYAGNMLNGATVKFTFDYLDDQDRLLFTNQSGIAGNFDQAKGMLTLTGSATVAQYQAALRSIQYTNTRTNPLAGLKQLDVVVQDGDTFSDPVFVLLAVDTELVAPTVTASTTAIAFTEGNAPIVVAADLTVSEQDAANDSGRSTVLLTGASVVIDGYVQGEDVLTFVAFESQPDADGETIVIDGKFDVNNGVLYLDGRATPDQYQAVLRSVRYQNVSAAPSTNSRVMNISVSQSVDFSDAPPITVTVTSLNDAPTRIVAPPGSATLLENAIHGSLGLEAINYAPPSPQQPYLVLAVSSVPVATLGSIELTRASGVVVAAVGGVYTLAEIRSAVFVPALNASGTGTFVFTVAGFNPILNQPDPAHLTESIRIDVAGVDTTNPGAAFVAQVFRDLLGRNATQQELDALDSQFVFAELSDNVLRENVVAAVRGSREYGQRVLTEAYERLLGRSPTQAEIEPWLGTEKIVEDFADGLLPATLQLSDADAAGSVEFQNGSVVFNDQFGTPFSLQTVDRNILKQNFTAEVTVSIPSSELGFFGKADSPQSVDVVGNTAYVVYGTGVLRVLDMSNPANITELGFFDSRSFSSVVRVVGNKAYVGGSAGLRVLNVSNPANITELGFFVMPSSPGALQVVGNTAYVAAGSSGLRVLDVSDPANIRELGSFATPNGSAADVQVIGEIAYVAITRNFLADSKSGLRVLNISDPANISELGFFETSQAVRLEVIDNTAYIADSDSGLRVLDVSNPASISELGLFVTGDFALDVKVLNRTAYVTGLAGFQVLDVSNAANISKFASFDLADRPNDWQFIGSTAYVAVGGDGLRVLDVPSVADRDKGAAYFGLETGDGLANKRLRVAPNQDSSVDVSFFIDSASSGGAGTHRLQVRWNALNQTAVFAIDEDYAGGGFVADYTFYPLSANINLEHVYFGSGAGTSFDDFAISFESPPNRLDEVNNHILSSPEYFFTIGGGSFETFVQVAFDDLVDREPTAKELDAAVSLLRSGTSRVDIARQIEFSDEATGIVADQMFEDLLRRTGNRFETVDTARRIHDLGSQVVINGMVASTEYYVRYGTQTSADSRSTEEIDATNAELIRHWLEGTPTVGNSQVTNDFEAVGTISTDGRAHAGGTLIASQYVLTAAHLVEGKDIKSLTFSVGLTSYGVEEAHVHPDYLQKFLGTDAGNDIAILKLNRPVVDVAPVSLWVGDLYAGDSLTLVGFGPHPGDVGFGTKRSGTTPIDGLTHNLVTWSYDGADETTTVPGDSGSPQFLKQGETYYVTSVTSGGTHQALSLGDFAYNTRVSSYSDWIDSVTNSQVTRSVSEGQDLSFTASSVKRPIFPSSFVTFNNQASVELSGNDLLIQDISTTDEVNFFYISTTATDVVISDAFQKLTTSVSGATGNNSNTITIPLSSFTGNIIVRSAGGNDVIDVTTPSRRVNIDAGDGLNRLVVNGSDTDQSEEFFVRESSTVAGSLEVNMPTASTDGPYNVQATRIRTLQLITGSGNDTVRPQNLSGLTTPLVNFLINLGNGDDVLNGTNGTIRMIVDGEEGNDSLIGGAANDQLTGGFGDDSLAGGPGDDTYVFDADDFIGADTISENPGEGSDTLDFSPTDFDSIGIDLRKTVSAQTVTTSNNLLIILSENVENVTGGSQGNAIIGNAGVNILRGGNGVDYIIGGGGAARSSA